MDEAVTKIVDLESSAQPDRRAMVERARTELGGDPRSVDYWASRAAKKIVLGEVEYQRRPGYVEQQRYFDACLAAEKRYHQACVRGSPRLALRSQSLTDGSSLCCASKDTLPRANFGVSLSRWSARSRTTKCSVRLLRNPAKLYDPNETMRLRQAFHAGRVALIQVRLSSRRKYRRELITAGGEKEADYNRATDAARARLDEAKADVGVSGQLWEPNPPDPRDIRRISINISKRTATAANHTRPSKKEQGAA